jgi:ribosomal protein S18 acetylase RimI-like enzyme
MKLIIEEQNWPTLHIIRISYLMDKVVTGSIELQIDHAKYHMLWALYTQPRFRQGGIGRKLLQEGINKFKELDPTKPIWLRVLRTNKEAINLYRSEGFRMYNQAPANDDEYIWMKKITKNK